ncbi:MAG: hypothetical protein WC505_07685 [Patescibacteria group bacterium]
MNPIIDVTAETIETTAKAEEIVSVPFIQAMEPTPSEARHAELMQRNLDDAEAKRERRRQRNLRLGH